jgi:hypothetical protein
VSRNFLTHGDSPRRQPADVLVRMPLLGRQSSA